MCGLHHPCVFIQSYSAHFNNFFKFRFLDVFTQNVHPSPLANDLTLCKLLMLVLDLQPGHTAVSHGP